MLPNGITDGILKNNLTTKSLASTVFVERSKKFLEHEPVSSELPYHMWYQVVEKYTTCGITKYEDKLITMSGLAEAFSGMVDDTYLAGMWRSQMPVNLLWTVKDLRQREGSLSFRPQAYRAPSWA
jgi:hypothetical protein